MTQTGEKTAIFCLAQTDWKLDQALDAYFANPEAYYKETRPTIDKRKLETTYNRFKDPSEPNKINTDGVVRMLEELQLDPSSRLVLLLAWKFKAETQCEFTREEFINGMTEMR